MKNLFKLNSLGNVQPKKKPVTTQHTVFGPEMTIRKRDGHVSSFSVSCTKELYKSCSRPHNTRVGQGTFIFNLQMKKESAVNLGCTHSYSLQTASGSLYYH